MKYSALLFKLCSLLALTSRQTKSCFYKFTLAHDNFSMVIRVNCFFCMSSVNNERDDQWISGNSFQDVRKQNNYLKILCGIKSGRTL